MALAVYYRFTPCCKTAHPCFFQLPVTPLPNLPLVYNYSGPTVIDSMGYQLETGKCYFVEQLSTSTDLPWVVSLFPCPEPNAITLLPFTASGVVCPPNPTPECPCVIPPNPTYNVYSLQPCCGGDPTIVYFVDDTLIDGSTYAYLSPNPDGNLVSPSCYTATQITYTGTGVPPFTQVVFSEFSIVNEGCGESGSPLTSICEVFCLPCICARYIWTGVTGPGVYTIDYIGCDDELHKLDIPTDGVTWTDKICLKYVVSVCSPNICWTSESYGNCIVDDSDTSDIKYDCPGCYELRDCTGVEPSIYTLSSQVAQYVSTQQVIQIVGSNTCWRVYDTTESCECAIVVTVESVFDDCPSCINPKGYKLTECTTGEVQYTTTDLSNYTTAILQTNCPGCWEVEPIDIVPPSSQPVTVISSFEDCKTCKATYYELTDCSGTLDPIVTITDLSEYVGKYILLKYCPDTCWEVQETTPQEIDGEVIVDEVFTSCTTCLLEVLKPKCVTFTNTNNISVSINYVDLTGKTQKVNIKANKTSSKVCALSWDLTEGVTANTFGDCVDGLCPETPQPKRKVTPGYNTPVCSTDYYEKVECSFSEWMYKDVLQKRYGISNCCPEELTKWLIKHEMLMLDILVNPDYECITTSTCGCPQACNCGYINTAISNRSCQS